MFGELMTRLLGRAFDIRISDLESRLERLERQMAKNREALKRLDSELDALEQYVRSDDETDAAEVDARTARIRQLIVEAQGSGEVADEDAQARERRLADVNDEAGTSDPELPAEGTDAAVDGGEAGDDAESGREAGSVDAPEGQPEQNPRPEVR